MKIKDMFNKTLGLYKLHIDPIINPNKNHVLDESDPDEVKGRNLIANNDDFKMKQFIDFSEKCEDCGLDIGTAALKFENTDSNQSFKGLDISEKIKFIKDSRIAEKLKESKIKIQKQKEEVLKKESEEKKNKKKIKKSFEEFDKSDIESNSEKNTEEVIHKIIEEHKGKGVIENTEWSHHVNKGESFAHFINREENNNKVVEATLKKHNITTYSNGKQILDQLNDQISKMEANLNSLRDNNNFEDFTKTAEELRILLTERKNIDMALKVMFELHV